MRAGLLGEGELGAEGGNLEGRLCGGEGGVEKNANNYSGFCILLRLFVS